MERLLPLVEAREGETVYLKGDEQASYGSVMAVLDLLRQGGIDNVAMVTRDPDRRRR